MNKLIKILVLVLAVFLVWFNLAESAIPTSLTAPTHPLLFGYYHVDSQYGDFKDEIKDYTNTQIILQESFLRTDLNNIQDFNDAFTETIALGHKIVYGVSSYWDQGLDAAQPYWNSIEFIYLADEPSWDKTQTEANINFFKSKVTQRNLSQKPIAINYTPGQIMTGTSYQATNLDIIGFEAYLDPSLQNGNVVQTLNTQIDQVKQKIGNKKMFIVIQAYDRNGAWTNMNSLIDIQIPPYSKAYNDNNVIGLFAFSYARPGGTKNLGILNPAHRLIGETILGIAPTTTPTDISNIQTKNVGSGTFPDVAWYNGKLWMAYQQDRGSNLYLYNFSSDLTNPTLFKTFDLGPGALAFARLYSANNILWLAYRIGEPSFDAKLWRSDTDAIESLGRAEGNDPIALGEGRIAWQAPPVPTYPIKIRNLTGGTIGNAGNGFPTGLSRIVDGEVITVDQDRNVISSGTRPSFAGSLAVVESPTDGNIIINTETGSVLATLFDGQASFTPRIATDNAGNYAIATWGSGGAGIRVATFTGPVASTPAISNGGQPFPSTINPTVPTQGLPTDLGQLIQQIFAWSLSILGISVFVMFFYSGFLWLTAAGNTAKISEARTHMTNAVFGAILLLSSYLILYTINPDFVKNTFNLPGLGTRQSGNP